MHYNSGIFAHGTRNKAKKWSRTFCIKFTHGFKKIVCKKHHQWTSCSFSSGLLIFLTEIKPVTTYYILVQNTWFSATYPFSFSFKQFSPPWPGAPRQLLQPRCYRSPTWSSLCHPRQLEPPATGQASNRCDMFPWTQHSTFTDIHPRSTFNIHRAK